MRVLKKVLLIFLIFEFIFIGGSTATQGDSLLRLHIRANSDAPEDQALKSQVRDTVLAVLNQRLRQANNAQSAQAEVALIMPEVLAAAQTTVAAAGFDYKVSAELGTATFPTRMYGKQVYRAGTYQALQINLGEGYGQNWWCVLFPPLCFVEIRSQSEKETIAVATVSKNQLSPPQAKSRLLIWWQRLFGK